MSWVRYGTWLYRFLIFAFFFLNQLKQNSMLFNGLSCKPNIYVSWSTSELRVRLVPWNRFKPSSKIFYWQFQGGTSFVDHLWYFCLVFVMPLCASVFCAFWSPAWKGLTYWLSVVVSSCEFVTFPLVSAVRCGTWLYRFLVFAFLPNILTLCYFHGKA